MPLVILVKNYLKIATQYFSGVWPPHPQKGVRTPLALANQLHVVDAELVT